MKLNLKKPKLNLVKPRLNLHEKGESKMMERKEPMHNESKRKSARKAYERVAKTSKPGTGARFAALTKSIAASGARNPAAVAASIGRAKYGSSQMTKWAVAHRR